MPTFSEEKIQDLQTIAEANLPFEALRDKRILVTGAGGLIASVFTEALLYLNTVYNLHLTVIALCRNAQKAQERFSAYKDDVALQFLEQDVCAPLPADFRADYIVHAASPAHPLAYAKTPVETMRANLMGTLGLLAHAKENGCTRFLLVSSSEVYGENTAEGGMDEQFQGKLLNTMQPRACYPESKRASETLCAAYMQEYGLDVTVVRPGYIYGAEITENNSRADAQFLRNAVLGEYIVMKSRGEQKRSYCYVADAASAMLFVLLCGQNGEAYNIANPNCQDSIREFAEALANAASVTVTFALPPETEARGYSKVNNSLLNAEKLLALGWKPKYNLQQGTAQAVKLARQK